MKDRLAQGLNTDWPSLVTQNGRQQNHYIGISGSTSDISYNLGLGYTELEGTYKGDVAIKDLILQGFRFPLRNPQRQRHCCNS